MISVFPFGILTNLMPIDSNSEFWNAPKFDCQYADENQILNFFKNPQNPLLITLGIARCGICNHKIGADSFLTNGKFFWSSAMIHLIFEHKLCLPDDFLFEIRESNFSIEKIDENRLRVLSKQLEGYIRERPELYNYIFL